ncbi:MAG TPA: alpha/beta fold hydrolase [Chryseolinea sp.]|nr:alpha/beta fold hydrolase [Chryseolinea sp.]HPH46008.1 alpha/beta fold hydrolase [Chryseolinea sp.]HPM29822.1 alpha/beta fold hydrolase [Chryseolinea sp.]
MKKFFGYSLLTILAIYFFACGFLYFVQDKLLFFPQKLDKDYSFQFDGKFNEKNIKAKDGTILNGLLFKADSSKGLIFYLHGNGGSLSSWGDVAKTYTELSYDVFILDYRGYGKSAGAITGQKQLYGDIQTVYDELKKEYSEDNIIVLGYSIGTGLASKVACENEPKLLILQAPYYSLTDMMRHTYSIIPTFILKYKLETNKNLVNCKMPVVIFHGDQDEVIYYGSSLKLKREAFKSDDKLITLRGQGHNGMTENEDYRSALKQILANE